LTETVTTQEVSIPRMGESITEVTLIDYTVAVGDWVNEEDTIAEVATDKVDSEIPAPCSGVVTQLLYQKEDVIDVGAVFLLIDTTETQELSGPTKDDDTISIAEPSDKVDTDKRAAIPNAPLEVSAVSIHNRAPRLLAPTKLSPLVKTIAKQAGISDRELAEIEGSGRDGRITKNDILTLISKKETVRSNGITHPIVKTPHIENVASVSTVPSVEDRSDVIVEMDRMRRMISDHMVLSKQTSPHVSTFLEVDVTNIVEWRSQNKARFQNQYQQKLTYTPIFFQIIARAILDFPAINASVEDYQVTIKKDINLGMAAALPTGNLIVPVIKNAERLNLIDMSKAVNDLAHRARINQLKPDEVQGGTFTISNIGTFGNDSGTPIINQPQAAILAIGAINKKPAVIETEEGDMIAIRHKMILSISFDHRIVDGFLGGSFLRRVGDYMEDFKMASIKE